MVVYKEPPLELTAKVKLSTEVSGSYDATQRNGSAQGTRWFVEKKPDYMQAGPWSTTIVVGNSSDNKTILRIDVFDHGNNFHAKWLNEKLIFIEVWWGRVYASDLIVDVEKKRIVYHEVGDYLALTFCKE
jgi:hypothetical protein